MPKIFKVDNNSIVKQGNITETIKNYFDKIGNKVVNPKLGIVELNAKGAKTTVFHGMSEDKLLAVASIKDVIEKGEIISHNENWKNRGYDTYVIAGKGDLNNKESIVGVIVKNYPKNNIPNKFYLHEVIKIGVPLTAVDKISTIRENEQTPISDIIIQQNQKNVNRENEIFTATKEENEYLSKQVDSWLRGEMKSGEQFRLGKTPEVLKALGAKDLPVVMSQNVMAKITGVKHNISVEDVKKLPNAIADPIMVFSSETVPNAYVILTELTDNNGKDIVTAMHLDVREYTHKINKIASVYGKDNVVNYVKKQINNGNLRYIEKNKSQEWSECRGLRLPKLNTILNSDNSILQKENIVNSYFEKNNKNLYENDKRYKISAEEIREIQGIGRKSINDFTSEDIKKTEKFARQYYREMGTKSPFFRAWFGDWRANDSTQVKVANEKGNARGIVKNKDTGWDIQISGKVFNETTRHASTKAIKAVKALEYINSIAENSVLLDTYTIASEKAKSENSALMHSLYAIADMGNGKELIKLYVEELNNVNSDGTIKRAYQLQNIKNVPLTGTKVNQNDLTPLTQQNTYSVSQLFEIVKRFDKNFQPKVASKVVNGDGSPKVVYHGTSENFNVFDITKSRSYDETLNYDMPGFYFSESTEESGSYGENLKAYYIDIKNPYTGDTYALQKEKGSFRKAYDCCFLNRKV